MSVSYFLLKHFRFNKNLFSTETMLKHVCSATRSSVACRSSSFRFSTAVQAPTSTSFEKMQKDKRYKVESEVPEAVLQSVGSNTVYSPGFSIKGESLTGRAAYLDFQATTPQDPRVLDAMMPFMVTQYGNPHSRTHSYGWETEAAVEEAREEIGKLIGATAKEIIFTSGATESNNMAVKGVARFYKGKKNHVITTQTEHKCVLDSCRSLEAEGFDVTYLPVLPNGLVDLDLLRSTIRPDTSLGEILWTYPIRSTPFICYPHLILPFLHPVSIMGVNNEIGVIQPLNEIGQMCRERKVFFHSDLAQMAGKMPVDVDALQVTLRPYHC